MYCTYYQANVDRSKTWYVTAILKSFPNLAFDRTIEKTTGLFEFYVAPGMENDFLELMNYFIAEGIVTNLAERPNRLLDPNEIVDKGM